MKNNYYQKLNHLSTTSIFKIFVLVMILLNLYVSSCITIDLSYFESIIEILNFPFYLIIFFFLMLSLSVKSYQIFQQNYLEIIRYDNKINCIKMLTKQLFLNISISFLLNLLFLLIGINLFHMFSIEINETINGINIVIYCCFYLIRFYVFSVLISLISLLMFSIFNQKFVLFLNIILLLTIHDNFIWLPYITIDEFNSIPIIFTGFFGGITCSNIIIDICATMGHTLIMIAIYYLLYFYICKSNKTIFE